MRKPIVKLLILAGFVLVLVLGLSSAAFASEWTDLPDSLTAEYGVTGEQVADISQGFNGEWKPYRDITRAQFVKMVVTASHIARQDPEEATFSDVPKGSLYYEYIEGAKAAGLVGGTTPTTFSPDDPITREEAVAVLARSAAGRAGADLSSRYAEGVLVALLANFADAATISPGLRAEIAYGFEYGIVKGNGERMLGPSANLWRIQAAALIIRAEPFIAPPPLSAPGDIASMLAGRLQAALLDVDWTDPKDVFSWVLETVMQGIEIPDQTILLLQDVTAKLDALSLQVTSLQNTVNNTAYDVLAASCAPVVSAIQTAQQLLTDLAASATPSQSQVDYIYRLIGEQIVPHKNQISNTMLGTGLADSLITSWSRAVAGRHHFFSKADSEAQFAMYNYWMDIQAIQTQLILEYYHRQGFTKETVYGEFDRYVMTRQAEQALFPRPFPYTSLQDAVYIVEHLGKSFMLNAQVFASLSGEPPASAIQQAIASVNAGTLSSNCGFENWRLPYYDANGATRSPDMPTIIKQPVTSDVRAWMIQEGWAPSRIPSRINDNTISLILYNVAAKTYTAEWNPLAYSLANMYVGPSSSGYFVLPIRSLEAGEFYFYK